MYPLSTFVGLLEVLAKLMLPVRWSRILVPIPLLDYMSWSELLDNICI
jgi:hypothetical protein